MTMRRHGPTYIFPTALYRKQRGCQMTSDMIAQIRINLESCSASIWVSSHLDCRAAESIEIAAKSTREMSAADGQALYDRMQAMVAAVYPGVLGQGRPGAAIGPPKGAAYKARISLNPTFGHRR